MVDRALTLITFLGMHWMILMGIASYNHTSVWPLIGAVVAWETMSRLFSKAVAPSKSPTK